MLSRLPLPKEEAATKQTNLDSKRMFDISILSALTDPNAGPFGVYNL